MEGEQFITSKQKVEFREIVLAHIRRILEISSKELRDTTRQITKGQYTNVVEQEDTRFSYIQAIENLAYVLIPYFDEEIEEVYKECIKVINSFDFDLQNDFEEEIKRIKKLKKIERLPDEYFITKKIEYAKKLFCELNLLLKRNDYLKSSVYGEDKDELGIEDDNKGDEE